MREENRVQTEDKRGHWRGSSLRLWKILRTMSSLSDEKTFSMADMVLEMRKMMDGLVLVGEEHSDVGKHCELRSSMCDCDSQLLHFIYIPQVTYPISFLYIYIYFFLYQDYPLDYIRKFIFFRDINIIEINFISFNKTFFIYMIRIKLSSKYLRNPVICKLHWAVDKKFLTAKIWQHVLFTVQKRL